MSLVAVRRHLVLPLLVLPLSAASWLLPGAGMPCTRRRAAAPLACQPFRSDDEYDYFRRQKEYSITLTKPLGAVLQEGAQGGVRVEELAEGGSAQATGLLKKE